MLCFIGVLDTIMLWCHKSCVVACAVLSRVLQCYGSTCVALLCCSVCEWCCFMWMLSYSGALATIMLYGVIGAAVSGCCIVVVFRSTLFTASDRNKVSTCIIDIFFFFFMNVIYGGVLIRHYKWQAEGDLFLLRLLWLLLPWLLQLLRLLQ